MEFKAFPKIERIDKVGMQITQKIHGSNAAVHIYEEKIQFRDDYETVTRIQCQSRNRIITPEDDNYGFATFVNANKQEFIDKLGIGLHFGEWAGPGINSGEGLKTKTFILFDFWKFPAERPLPPGCAVVPLLYQGKLDADKITETMEDLRVNGSKLMPGFMSVEGVVINLNGQRYKKVFKEEETSWKKEGSKNKEVRKELEANINVDHLLQPIRLEKLLSRDERLLIGYPGTLPLICKDYIQDLMDEGQISGTEDEIKAIKKALGSKVYGFVKALVKL
jgi:hypothetical protein